MLVYSALIYSALIYAVLIYAVLIQPMFSSALPLGLQALLRFYSMSLGYRAAY